jgi:hypothetical protein
MVNDLLSKYPTLKPNEEIVFERFSYGVYGNYIHNPFRPSDYGIPFDFQLLLEEEGAPGPADPDDPDDPDDPAASDDPSGKPYGDGDGKPDEDGKPDDGTYGPPKTGDDQSMAPYGILLAASLTIFVWAAMRRRKMNTDK